MTSRRGFLKGVVGAAGAVVALPLLKHVQAIEGAIPSVAYKPLNVASKDNQLLTPEMITKEALRILEESLRSPSIMTAISSRKSFAGSTLKIRAPAKFS